MSADKKQPSEVAAKPGWNNVHSFDNPIVPQKSSKFNVRADTLNFSTSVDNLMEQASRQMVSDPARYGLHFLIWLSLYRLKNGLDWPVKRVSDG